MGMNLRKCVFSLFKTVIKILVGIVVLLALLVALWFVVPDAAPSLDEISSALDAGWPVTRAFAIDDGIARNDLPRHSVWGIADLTTPTHFAIGIAVFRGSPVRLSVGGYPVSVDFKNESQSVAFRAFARVGDLDLENVSYKFTGADALQFMWWVTGQPEAYISLELRRNASAESIEIYRAKGSNQTPLITLAIPADSSSAPLHMNFARNSTSSSKLYAVRLSLFVVVFCSVTATVWFFVIGLRGVVLPFVFRIIGMALMVLYTAVSLVVTVLGTASLVCFAWWTWKGRREAGVRVAFSDLLLAIRNSLRKKLDATDDLVDLDGYTQRPRSEQLVTPEAPEQTLIIV